ncbi:MAG: hypothetical protein U5K79_15435 [Cyclobacteriaceae bacterium]|nr:hypothetical protein [Cyclobacteriaceae bacterium]
MTEKGLSETLATNQTTISTTDVSSNSVNSDTLSYAGYIHKFRDNDTFYTDLYFLNDINDQLYLDISKMGDSLVFEDEENRRTLIDLDKAGKYFNLTGLHTINIYNSENDKLTTGRFDHIEYVEGNIESSFAAVFLVENPHAKNPLFCIGNPADDLEKVSFTSFEDENLKSKLIEYLGVDSSLLWNVSHYNFNSESILSTVSANTTAYIIETKENTLKTLYKSKDDEAIFGLNVISKKINGREVLLADCVMPETDMTWTSVLLFNGSEYESTKDRRIRAK